MAVNAPARAYSGSMDVDEFMAFLETRPHGEHWELIDGVAVMAAPASYAHRRIAGNLCELLNGAFATRRADLFIHARRSNWQSTTLKQPNDPIEMPELGLLCSVADLYRGTPLEPRRGKGS